jgi:hypothetical protein
MIGYLIFVVLFFLGLSALFRFGVNAIAIL